MLRTSDLCQSESIHSGEGLMLETSALKPLYGGHNTTLRWRQILILMSAKGLLKVETKSSFILMVGKFKLEKKSVVNSILLNRRKIKQNWHNELAQRLR